MGANCENKKTKESTRGFKFECVFAPPAFNLVLDKFGRTQGRISFQVRFRLQIAIGILNLQPTLKTYSIQKIREPPYLHVFAMVKKHF